MSCMSGSFGPVLPDPTARRNAFYVMPSAAGQALSTALDPSVPNCTKAPKPLNSNVQDEVTCSAYRCLV